MVGMLGASRKVFVCRSNCVNLQIGGSVIPDHYLPGLLNSVMPHIVAGPTCRKSSAVDVNPPPRAGVVVSHKDSVRNRALLRAEYMQIISIPVAEKLAIKIDQRDLTAGRDRRHLLIRRSQRVFGSGGAAGLVGNHFPQFAARWLWAWRRSFRDVYGSDLICGYGLIVSG